MVQLLDVKYRKTKEEGCGCEREKPPDNLFSLCARMPIQIWQRKRQLRELEKDKARKGKKKKRQGK